MVKRDVWEDKLYCDKASYYNRTRMSLEFFANKLGIAPQVLIDDLRRGGYCYIASERKFVKGSFLKNTLDIADY